jgi:hypothetical protein
MSIWQLPTLLAIAANLVASLALVQMLMAYCLT